MPELFSRKKRADAKAAEEHEARLYEQVGKLQVELEWLKKKLGSLELTTEAKRMLIEHDSQEIPVVRQCELLQLSRSSLYYRAYRNEQGEAFERRVVNAIDELYTAHPHLGRYGMTDALAQACAIEVNPKRVGRLMKTLGLEAVYPRPRRNTSQPNQEHRKYPYLLRNLDITAPDQVWCADITYIRLHRGFAYLVAVMDWFSRCVLAWELSNTLDANFCVAALREALAGGREPAIFNTDQGSQFTSAAFTGVLIEAGIAISMDGVGRAFDNIMVERLWRTVKYEDVYLRDYETPAEARLGLGRYFAYYNHQRRHRSLGRRTPASVYGLETTGSSERILVPPTRSDRIETGVGWSVAANAAVAPVALRAPSATAAEVLPMVMVPPYSRPETVQRMGTS
jgi:putative transposase